MLEYLKERERDLTKRQPRSLSKTQTSNEKFQPLRLIDRTERFQKQISHTKRENSPQRRRTLTSKGRSSAGLLQRYQQTRPCLGYGTNSIDRREKPLMEKNYNEQIIMKKIQQTLEKETHKIMLMKALSSYKKLQANNTTILQESHSKQYHTQEDLEKKKEVLYKTLETNKWKIIEDHQQTSKQFRQKLLGRSVVGPDVVSDNMQSANLSKIRHDQKLKMEEMDRREQERREAQRLRYERTQQQRREKQRRKYEDEQQCRRAQDERRRSQAKQSERIQNTRNIQPVNKNHLVLNKAIQDDDYTTFILNPSNNNAIKRAEAKPKLNSEEPFVEYKEQKILKNTPKYKPVHEQTFNNNQRIQIQTFQRQKEPQGNESGPKPTKKQTQAEIKKTKEVTPQNKPSKTYYRDDNEEIESITLDHPNPNKSEKLQNKPSTLQKPQSKVQQPKPIRTDQKSATQVSKPPQPSHPKKTVNASQSDDQDKDIEEMRQMLNMVGETIGHGTQNLKGIDIGWMTPCFFLYRRFYQLRIILMEQYTQLQKDGQATKEEIQEIIGQNEKVKISLEKMAAVCIKKCTDPNIKAKFSEKFEAPVCQHLYKYVEEYISEVSHKGSKLHPEQLLRVKVHLLEILNSLLIVQEFAGHSTNPLTPQQLASDSTRTKIDKILKQHLASVREYTTIKH